jgi:hypothetical protein
MFSHKAPEALSLSCGKRIVKGRLLYKFPATKSHAESSTVMSFPANTPEAWGVSLRPPPAPSPLEPPCPAPPANR